MPIQAEIKSEVSATYLDDEKGALQHQSDDPVSQGRVVVFGLTGLLPVHTKLGSPDFIDSTGVH